MTDQECMARAIELAKRGRGWTNPNPLVGAVIAKEGRIIGEGWHARCGELHAERNAIRALTERAEGATLYVTLEPCCHYGRTPPCTDAILEQKIARVVIGSGDPNPKVSGKGAAILRRAGVQVEEGFMRDACDRLNPVFFHYITTGNPYVIMKYAMTADGKIAARTGDSKWITGEASRRRVQELRWNCMGIMAGIGTVLADDPLLTVREEGRRNPIRIICDSRLRLPPDSRLCRSAEQYPVIAACSAEILEREDGCRKRKQILEGLGVKVLPVPDSPRHVNLPALMELLGREKIDSILLEGGRRFKQQCSPFRNYTGDPGVYRSQNFRRRLQDTGGRRGCGSSGRGGSAGDDGDRENRTGSSDYLESQKLRKGKGMFTGIVEETGKIRGLSLNGTSGSISVEASRVLEGTKIGDSIAVSGICLTVTALRPEGFTADVMAETVRRSSLSACRPGDLVNLERAMAADGRFGGHIVSGHIDGTGRIVSLVREQNAVWAVVRAEPELLKLIVEKGSICMDGISLTVASAGPEEFRVSVIPHTWQATSLRLKRPGDPVNLETDIIGKYVAKLLGFLPGTEEEKDRRISRGITMEMLRKLEL